jgi:hypothetical protein
MATAEEAGTAVAAPAADASPEVDLEAWYVAAACQWVACSRGSLARSFMRSLTSCVCACLSLHLFACACDCLYNHRPHLSQFHLYCIIAVNVGSLVLAWFLLRVVYPPPSPEETARNKKMNEELERVRDSYMSMGETVRHPKGSDSKDRSVALTVQGEAKETSGLLQSSNKPVECAEGESAGHSAPPSSPLVMLASLLLALNHILSLSDSLRQLRRRVDQDLRLAVRDSDGRYLCGSVDLDHFPAP